MKKILLSAAVLMLLLVPFAAKAAYTKSSDSGTLTVAAGDKVKNAYLAGYALDIDGKVEKDLVAAGSTIDINGNVENNANIAGNIINIKGQIGDSARILGSDISLENSIGADALIAGDEVTISDKSNITGDLFLVANKARIGGQIGGNAKIIGSEITLSGKITGDVLVKNVQKLTITKDAIINGKLTYSSPNQAEVGTGATILGGVDYSKSKSNEDWKSVAKRTSAAVTLYQIIGTILILLLFVYIAPKNSKRFIDLSITEGFKNLWMGLLILIVTPILGLILLAISFKLTAILFVSYALFLLLASTFSALIAGSWLMKIINKDENYQANWQSVLVGAILIALLAFIPMAGALLIFLLMLISLGAITKLSYEGVAK